MRKQLSVLLLVFLATTFVMAQAPTSLYESFESAWTNGGTTPAGWTKTNVVGNANWGQKAAPLAGTGSPLNGLANQGLAVAWFPAGSASPGTTTRLESPTLDFSAAAKVRVRFFYVNVPGIDTSRHSHDTLRVRVSSDGGGTWITRGTLIDTTTVVGTWRQGYVVLDTVAGRANVKIGFEAVADSNGRDIWLDRVVVQYPAVSIRQVQQVSMDSLLVADVIQNTFPARGVLQYSPYTGDTVTVTAQCVVPYKILTFTARGWTMLLYDTSSVSQWKGVLARVNPVDTAQITLDGFTNPAAGDIITMVCAVSEFPTDMNSATQLQPIPRNPITIIGSAPLPVPVPKPVTDFYTGIFPGGKVKYSTGEPYEGMIVQLTNLTLDAKVDLTRGTFSAQDQYGNEVTTYDASRYFTLKGSSADHPFPDSVWTKTFAGLGLGVRIDSLRGYMTTVSGSQSPRGYRICPIYRNDIAIGRVPPSITTHRRFPVVVTPDSGATVSVKAAKQTGGAAVASVKLYYSVNSGPWVADTMKFRASDTTYNDKLPQEPADTFVRYFMQATDSLGVSATLASSAFGAFTSDTSKGVFFYASLARPLTIRDVQFTPFANGRSGYLGAVLALRGVVTADTAHMLISPIQGTNGTNAYYMQNGNQTWSGIWVTGTDSTLKTMRNGDSISVTGTVQENNEVTALGSVTTPISILAHGLPEPAPVNLSTAAFGPGVGNGFASAEPYEGMLVRFRNVTVTDTASWVFSDATEYAVADSTGSPVLVRRDGRNSYSNIPADSATGKKILRPSNKIASLTGVMWFGFNRWMIVPRTDADFGLITAVEPERGGTLPVEYALMQNYPNPFNPSTVIEYALPKSTFVTLTVYNLLGQEVKTLVNEQQAPGRYSVRFSGSSLASGVYLYRLQAGSFTQVQKMLMLK